jgi:hypothetical protein
MFLHIPSKWYFSRFIAHLGRYFSEYSIQDTQNEPLNSIYSCYRYEPKRWMAIYEMLFAAGIQAWQTTGR